MWTVLYLLIAVAGWLVWRRVGFGPALYAYGAQLALNAIWTQAQYGSSRTAAGRETRQKRTTVAPISSQSATMSTKARP